jgi:hypothetical protein
MAADDIDQVQRVIDALPPGLHQTLEGLAGAPWETVVAVFGLLRYDQWAAAKTLGLAAEGEVTDEETGVRPIVPTDLARLVIGSMEAPPSKLTLEDVRLNAKELINRIPSHATSEVAAQPSH